ncbi:Heparan sulfate 2-O-sulfotransferase 1, partial [Nibea albiflora]
LANDSRFAADPHSNTHGFSGFSPSQKYSACTSTFAFTFVIIKTLSQAQLSLCARYRQNKERAIARHEVREIEQRHTQDGLRERDSSVSSSPDNEDDIVIIYNRVPKTASTSFTNIAYDLCGKNHYHVLHINTTKNNPVMSIQDQVRFVKNVTEWREMKPAFYHGHVSFLDFTKFGIKKKPIYINVIRDPIERLVSYYYFLRFGDDYRPGLRRRKQGDKKVQIH